MTICSECKKEYGTYPVIITGETESIAFEFALREVYYNDDINIGLCRECRDKVYEDKDMMGKLWLLAKAKTMVLLSKSMEEDNMEKTRHYKKVIENIEKIEKELDKNVK